MVSKKAITDIEKVIEEMGLEELVALRDGLSERITTKQSERRESLIAEFTKKAEALGIDPRALFGYAPAAKAKRSGGERASPKAKYRDPATGETWSGRGRPAKWLAHYIAEGKKKEDFLIK